MCQVVKENYKGNKCKQKLLKQSLVWLMFFWVSTTYYLDWKEKSPNMYHTPFKRLQVIFQCFKREIKTFRQIRMALELYLLDDL